MNFLNNLPFNNNNLFNNNPLNILSGVKNDIKSEVKGDIKSTVSDIKEISTDTLNSLGLSFNTILIIGGVVAAVILL